MHVAAIDVDELAGGVAGAVGEKEGDRVGDFFAGGHALAERDAGLDLGAGGSGVGLGGEPGLVHRRPAFSDDDGVDADAVFGQLDRPLARQRVAAAVGRGVSRSAALARFGDFGADVIARYPAAAFSSPAEAIARVTGDAQFVCEARRLARSVERSGTPVFLYSYEYEIDALSLDHVIHGLESHIVFGNNYTPPLFAAHTLDAADLALHGQMAGYWTRFAGSGNPNADDDTIVHWPAFKHPSGNGRGSDKYLVFDQSIREGLRPAEAACDFFEPLFLRSVLVGVPASAK